MASGIRRRAVGGKRMTSASVGLGLASAVPVGQCVQALLEAEQEVEGLERGKSLYICGPEFFKDRILRRPVSGQGKVALRSELADGERLAFLEVSLDLLCPLDDRGRETCEAGDGDAVAFVRRARLELAHEKHLPALFFDREAEVGAAGQELGDVGQLVVVGGEESLRTSLG